MHKRGTITVTWHIFLHNKTQKEEEEEEELNVDCE